MEFRVGLGQDSHRIKLKVKNLKLKVEKPLVLGGVLVDEEIEVVKVNSDGDAILHALCNALSTAIGGRSLGFYEPYLIERGITDSKEYVRFFRKKVERKGLAVYNVSIAVEAKVPKLENFAPKMKKIIARLLNISQDRVGISFTTGEGLTAFGKGEGIQALAAVSLTKNEK